MNNTNTPYAALFDLDGVIIDTESQYSLFWNDIGNRYLHDADFGCKVKGKILVNICGDYFASISGAEQTITAELNDFESNMQMPYVPGVQDFLRNLRANGVKIAVVTSSNKLKMASVYRRHPEFTGYFDRILTSEDFTRGKPFPDCYLLGAKVFSTTPDHCVVFEDSFHGLAAGNAAGMNVIGLATTNSAESIRTKANAVIPDFTGITWETVQAITKETV